MQSATIELCESFEIEHDPEIVWGVLRDPRIVAHCIPGASLGEEMPDGSVEGTLTAALGPTKVTFRGTVIPSFDESGHRGSLTGNAADRRGGSKANVVTSFRVEPAAAGAHSTVIFEMKCAVLGGISPFLRTGGVHLARQMISEFADNLRRCCGAQAPVAGRYGQAMPVPASPPKASQLVLRILRGVFAEMIRRLWDFVRKRGSRQAS